MKLHPITVASRELVKQITAINVVDDQRDPKLVAVVVAAVRRVNDSADVFLSVAATGKRHRVRLAVPDETDSADDAVAEDREDLPT